VLELPVAPAHLARDRTRYAQDGRLPAPARAGLTVATSLTGARVRVNLTLYCLKMFLTAATKSLSSLVSFASSWINSRKVVLWG